MSSAYIQKSLYSKQQQQQQKNKVKEGENRKSVELHKPEKVYIYLVPVTIYLIGYDLTSIFRYLDWPLGLTDLRRPISLEWSFRRSEVYELSIA